MASRFTIKEIAHQAGLSLATVDRALHGRDHVRAGTAARVAAAVAELERQQANSGLLGARVTLDVVMQAPARFTGAVRAALEAELPLMRPATFRTRFHLAERWEERELVALLRAIARRGSQGIVLKAPASAGVLACLAEIKVPVVTYVTDVPTSLRLAYVGMQNARAGATAAYLLARMAPLRAAKVLVTLSSQMFEGEDARRAGFVEYLAAHAPHLGVVVVSEGFGVDLATGALIGAALAEHADIRSVYSIGGGNRAVLAAFAEAGRTIEVFAAHDLDAVNTELLAQGRLSFVIHHAFRQDARRIALHFAKAYRLVDMGTAIEETEINIACPVEV